MTASSVALDVLRSSSVLNTFFRSSADNHASVEIPSLHADGIRSNAIALNEWPLRQRFVRNRLARASRVIIRIGARSARPGCVGAGLSTQSAQRWPRVRREADDGASRAAQSGIHLCGLGIRQRASSPTHTSPPSCSRLSGTSPSRGRKRRPSLTAAARDGRNIVQAGTEKWLRQAPNQRMSRHRTAACRQITQPDPK